LGGGKAEGSEELKKGCQLQSELPASDCKWGEFHPSTDLSKPDEKLNYLQNISPQERRRR